MEVRFLEGHLSLEGSSRKAFRLERRACRGKLYPSSFLEKGSLLSHSKVSTTDWVPRGSWLISSETQPEGRLKYLIKSFNFASGRLSVREANSVRG